MKYIFTLLISSLLLVSCTFEKGEVALPATDCVNDSTIDLIDVAMGDNFFNPTDITIVSGDTVRWTMTTSVPHTSTCDGTNGTELPSGAAAWDSGVLFNPGESYKVKLTVPGRYKYYCVVHGISMAGIIVVKPRCQ